jgi:hypothetical protein
MNTFDPTAHPRGQAKNAGQFREKEVSRPESALAADEPEWSLPETDESYANEVVILIERLPDLEAAIAKANRRLAKAGVEEKFSFTWEQSIWKDGSDREWLVADVTISHPKISVGNWQFLAAHEKAPSGQIVSYYPHPELPRIPADISMRCDQCGKAQQRLKAYTVYNNETGETKQVGSSCLALFLGVRPEGLWAMAAEVGADFDVNNEFEHIRSSPSSNMYRGDELLLATLRQVDLDDGVFVSKSKATADTKSTVSKVAASFHTLTSTEPSKSEKEELAGLLAWVRDQNDSDNDYLKNLHAVLSPAEGSGDLIVASKHAALAASAVSSYRRHLARQVEAKAKEDVKSDKKQEFMFEPGDSLKEKDLELTVISMNVGQDYGYGAPTHVNLMDAEGHVFYWKASGSLGSTRIGGDEDGRGALRWSPNVGSKVKITGGRVKDHRVSEYNGDFETVIWRVKLEPTEETVQQVLAEDAAS